MADFRVRLLEAREPGCGCCAMTNAAFACGFSVHLSFREDNGTSLGEASNSVLGNGDGSAERAVLYGGGGRTSWTRKESEQKHTYSPNFQRLMGVYCARR